MTKRVGVPPHATTPTPATHVLAVEVSPMGVRPTTRALDITNAEVFFSPVRVEFLDAALLGPMACHHIDGDGKTWNTRASMTGDHPTARFTSGGQGRRTSASPQPGWVRRRCGTPNPTLNHPHRASGTYAAGRIYPTDEPKITYIYTYPHLQSRCEPVS